MAQSTRIDPRALTGFAARVLETGGVGRADAELVAESLVDADLRGIHSHGVSRLGIYLERLRRGGNAASRPIEVLADAPALVLLDGGDSLAQVPSARAVAIAIERAATVGCAAVCVRAGSHFGAAGYWARRIAEAGMLGVASTNGSPLMVPWGSAVSAIGTNPLAMAFPSSQFEPVVVDLATSETTWGALVNAAAVGAPIPPSWALDRDGAPTTDAAAAVEARRLLPFGRHKGSAIAVGVELLAGALAGARCLTAASDMYAQPAVPLGLGHFFLALDARTLGPEGTRFADAVAAVQRELNGLPPASGVERVLWPGQLEAERAADGLEHGLPLPDAIATDLELVATAANLTDFAVSLGSLG
jgi:LDH2 family malate/lactate/ureidoglycolate dehydrogenase